MGEQVAVPLVMIPVVLLALLVALVIPAMILRAAVSLYNKLAGGAGSPGAVPQPSLLKAIGIVFLTWLVNIVVGFTVGAVVGVGLAAGGASPREAALVAQLFSLPMSFLVMAVMLSALLPTTFGRAILVTLCCVLVWVFVLVVVGVLLAAFFVFTGGFA